VRTTPQPSKWEKFAHADNSNSGEFNASIKDLVPRPSIIPPWSQSAVRIASTPRQASGKISNASWSTAGAIDAESKEEDFDLDINIELHQ
jgi:hypothetical protein